MRDFHDTQDANRITKREGKESVRFREFGSENQNPQPVRHEHIITMETRIAGREQSICEITSGVSLKHVSEQCSQRHDGKESKRRKRDEEMDDTDCEGDISLLVESENVHRGCDVENKEADKQHKATEKRLSSSESSRNVGIFGDGGDDHDERSDSTTQRNCSPLSRSRWVGFFGLDVSGDQKRRRVEGRVVPEEGDVNDPDTIEVGGHVEPGTRFFVGFEEDFLPFDLTEFEESLTCGNIDDSGLVLQNDSFDALRIPEQLIYVVVSDDFVVISFASNVFAVINLVALTPDILIERGNDIVEIVPFLERFVARLTFRRAKIIVATFEDEAKTLRYKTNLICFTPTTQIQCKLPCTIMLRHLIHL